MYAIQFVPARGVPARENLNRRKALIMKYIFKNM